MKRGTITTRTDYLYFLPCIRFCSFPHFYVTSLPTKSADIGLAEVAVLKGHFRQCEGFNAETLTEILKIYIHNNSIVFAISTLILLLVLEFLL